MNKYLSLSELNLQIKDTLTDKFMVPVWVVAEISELNINKSGHCYLELIEKDEFNNTIKARNNAIIWSYVFRILKPYFETTTNHKFSSGIQVLVQATIEFHEVYGLSLNIKDIDPVYTIGDLARQREEIINKLKAEGVFDMNKELPIPLVPQRIAIISSATAAGYEDFIHQLEKNPYGFKFSFKLFEAFMQGENAVFSIISALEEIYSFEDSFDAVAIIRGGGAQSDLKCFDDYNLAYHVAQFPLPVITGIGHEKDDTITDLVAHTRLKTPTAVAEFFIIGMLEFAEKLYMYQSRIVEIVHGHIDREYLKLEKYVYGINNKGKLFLAEKNKQFNKLGHKYKNSINRFSYQKINHLNELVYAVRNSSFLFFYDRKNDLKNIKVNAGNLVRWSIKNKSDQIKINSESLKGRLDNRYMKEFETLNIHEKTIGLLNPENVLKRGYTVTLKDSKIIKSSKILKEDDLIEIKFYDGNVKSRIIKK